MADDALWEPEHRGDVVIGRDGSVWERTNRKTWVCRGTFGRMKWTDLQREYGPTTIYKAKGVTANG